MDSAGDPIDRISALPNELLHAILAFVDYAHAVTTHKHRCTLPEKAIEWTQHRCTLPEEAIEWTRYAVWHAADSFLSVPQKGTTTIELPSHGRTGVHLAQPIRQRTPPPGGGGVDVRGAGRARARRAAARRRWPHASPAQA